MRCRCGFTLIEMLVVVGLMAVVGLIGTPYVLSSLQRNYLRSSGEQVVSLVRRAQVYGMMGKDSEVWGLCWVDAGQIRLFAGSCGSPVYEEVVDLPESVSMNVFNETTFSLLRGMPSGSLAIELVLDDGSGLEIAVSEAGAVNLSGI